MPILSDSEDVLEKKGSIPIDEIEEEVEVESFISDSEANDLCEKLKKKQKEKDENTNGMKLRGSLSASTKTRFPVIKEDSQNVSRQLSTHTNIKSPRTELKQASASTTCTLISYSHGQGKNKKGSLPFSLNGKSTDNLGSNKNYNRKSPSNLSIVQLQAPKKSISKTSSDYYNEHYASGNLWRRVIFDRKMHVKDLQSRVIHLERILDDTSREKRVVQQLNKRQEKALRKYEDDDAELPKLIKNHRDEVNRLKETLRKVQNQSREAEEKLRIRDKTIIRIENDNQKYLGMIKKSKLDERIALQDKLEEALRDLKNAELKISEDERKIEMLEKNYRHQITVEERKVRLLNQRLFYSRQEIDRLHVVLKDRERTINCMAIRHNPQTEAFRQSLPTVMVKGQYAQLVQSGHGVQQVKQSAAMDKICQQQRQSELYLAKKMQEIQDLQQKRCTFNGQPIVKKLQLSKIPLPLGVSAASGSMSYSSNTNTGRGGGGNKTIKTEEEMLDEILNDETDNMFQFDENNSNFINITEEEFMGNTKFMDDGDNEDMNIERQRQSKQIKVGAGGGDNNEKDFSKINIERDIGAGGDGDSPIQLFQIANVNLIETDTNISKIKQFEDPKNNNKIGQFFEGDSKKKQFLKEESDEDEDDDEDDDDDEEEEEEEEDQMLPSVSEHKAFQAQNSAYFGLWQMTNSKEGEKKGTQRENLNKKFKEFNSFRSQVKEEGEKEKKGSPAVSSFDFESISFFTGSKANKKINSSSATPNTNTDSGI